jgi:pilus assembly protein FimV
MGALRRISLCAWVSGAIIAAASLQSNAAGLGRLDVKSVLGEPLRAEVTVLAKPSEVQTMKVQLASPQAYEAVGLVHTLFISQLAVSFRQDTGELPIVSITSVDPIDEPVLDLLLELTWASGRVTREYTAFIDPPFIVAERDQRRVEEAMAAREANVAARAAEMQVENKPSGAETQAATAPVSPTPEPLPEEPVAIDATQEIDLGPVETIGGTAPTLFGAVPTVSTSVGADTAIADESVSVSEEPINVVRGDTLSKIALANKPAGVTLNQMLVVLYRNNRQAFSGGNMNRLRTGKIIRLADPDEYRQFNVADATREVRAQTTSWKAYKQQLAAASVQRAEQLPQQAAGGAVTPKIQVPLPPSGTSPEVVKLSRGDPATAGQGASQAASVALQEKLVATEKALGESSERVTRLEKIIEDLQKLAEVQSSDMAELQSQAGTAAQPKPAPAAPQAAPAQPSQLPAPAKPGQASPNIQPGPDSAAPAKPGQSAPVAGQTGTPAPAKAPPAATAKPPKTTPTARKPRSRPQPQPPQSLLDRAFAQPYLFAIPVIVIALIGWGAWRLKGRFGALKAGFKKKKEPAVVGSAETASGSGAFSPDATDIGFPGRAAKSGEEVDPLEEAEIFLAYGRDAQAEELLQEALAIHPGRFEIHLKLLEIYAKQSNKEAFEKLARIIQQEPGSEGEIWDRVAKLGYSVDPENPRYADGAAGQGEQSDYDQSASDISSSTDHLDFDVGMGDSTDQDASSEPGADIDLGDGDSKDFAKTQVMSSSTTHPGGESAPIESDLNLDLPPVDDGAGALDLSVDDGGNMLDFDFDSAKIGDEPDDSDKSDETATTSIDPGLEFNIDDISLGNDDVSLGGGDEEQSESSEAPALDLSGISLDLDETTADLPDASGKDDKWYEVQTKFDLAKAYQEMGDNDGAREILKEVISEGDSDQKVAAESVLSSLG